MATEHPTMRKRRRKLWEPMPIASRSIMKSPRTEEVCSRKRAVGKSIHTDSQLSVCELIDVNLQHPLLIYDFGARPIVSALDLLSQRSDPSKRRPSNHRWERKHFLPPRQSEWLIVFQLMLTIPWTKLNDSTTIGKSHPPVGQPWPSRAQGRWHKDLAWNLGTFSKMKNLRLGSTRTRSRLTSLRGVIYHHYYAYRPAVGTDSTRRGGGGSKHYNHRPTVGTDPTDPGFNVYDSTLTVHRSALILHAVRPQDSTPTVQR